MTHDLATITLPLFVPGDRPDRFAKAAAAGPDAVIVDLEDAVPAPAKEAARAGIGAALAQAAITLPVLLRINAADSAWHAADLRAARDLPLAAIVLPKAETAADLVRVADATGRPVIALVETARGLAGVEALAPAAARIAFGSIDYAADLAIGHTRQSLLQARSRLTLASRLAGLPAPLDGVTTAIHDADTIVSDCAHAVEMGFGGKLLIHPAQIAPARQGFAPSQAEIDWAGRVLAAVAGGDAALAVDGAMVDAPVIARARQILARTA
ncbi:MAG: HpcH/HpaI aldolase/citrate lyase family protein [Pseudorhodobacter sp.]